MPKSDPRNYYLNIRRQKKATHVTSQTSIPEIGAAHVTSQTSIQEIGAAHVTSRTSIQETGAAHVTSRTSIQETGAAHVISRTGIQETGADTLSFLPAKRPCSHTEPFVRPKGSGKSFLPTHRTEELCQQRSPKWLRDWCVVTIKMKTI